MEVVESRKSTSGLKATPGKSAVPHPTWGQDGEALRGEASTRDSPEQERDWCHKSGPELKSEGPQRSERSGAENASCGGKVWSGDASLQQTIVPGRGDGCGTRPGGNANEIQEVMADCNEGRPSSGGNSLSSVFHLQSSEGRKHVSVPQQTNTHSQFDKTPLSSPAVSCPTKKPTTWDQSLCREMDECRGLEEVLEVRAKPIPSLGLSSLVNAMSGIVQGASQRILNSSFMLQQVLQQNWHPYGAGWSSRMVSLIRDSKVLSILKDSKVISLVKDSYITSLLSDFQIFSLINNLPLVQYIQLEMMQHLHAVSATTNPVCTKDYANLVVKSSSFPQEQGSADKVEAETMAQSYIDLEDSFGLENMNQTHDTTSFKDFQTVVTQSLIHFPDLIVRLQTSLSDLKASLQSVLPNSLHTSQNVVFFWLKAAKTTEPKATPALVVVMESTLFTLTENCGELEIFYQLPLVQLKEVQVGFAGHSLCLMGPTEENVLGLYTFNQTLTKELCRAVLGLIFPGDDRVTQHPLLHGDLMEMSLKWQGFVPDMLLDAGVRVCCHFQKCLANLVYLLHCNTNQEQSCLGEVRLLLYCCVGICYPSHVKVLGQLFVTDTHLGLVQEDIVFHPVGAASPEPYRLQFHFLTVRQLCDVRGVVVRDEDERGAVTVDVILANVKARGHPESVSELCVHSHAEVWKLTFSCSTEAACLINHLSNV